VLWTPSDSSLLFSSNLSMFWTSIATICPSTCRRMKEKWVLSQFTKNEGKNSFVTICLSTCRRMRGKWVLSQSAHQPVEERRKSEFCVVYSVTPYFRELVWPWSASIDFFLVIQCWCNTCLFVK
jgi:hypothetical protein